MLSKASAVKRCSGVNVDTGIAGSTYITHCFLSDVITLACVVKKVRKVDDVRFKFAKYQGNLINFKTFINLPW